MATHAICKGTPENHLHHGEQLEERDSHMGAGGGEGRGREEKRGEEGKRGGGRKGREEGGGREERRGEEGKERGEIQFLNCVIQ